MKKEEIIEMENQLLKGIKTSDVALLNTILPDDLLFTAPTGQVITKEMDLASHRAGEMEVEQLISTVENINIIGDNAVVVIVYETKGKMLGNSIQGKFRYIRIWKMFSGQLKVIGGSCFKL